MIKIKIIILLNIKILISIFIIYNFIFQNSNIQDFYFFNFNKFYWIYIIKDFSLISIRLPSMRSLNRSAIAVHSRLLFLGISSRYNNNFSFFNNIFYNLIIKSKLKHLKIMFYNEFDNKIILDLANYLPKNLNYLGLFTFKEFEIFLLRNFLIF